MNIYGFEMRRQARGLFWWVLILGGMLLVYLASFPSMRDIAIAKFDALPKEMLLAFNIDPSLNLADFNQYFAMIYSYMMLGVAGYAAVLGANTLSQEESDGTIEYLNAQSVSRVKIVTSKLLATLSALVIVVAVLILVSFLGGTMFGSDSLDVPSVLKVIALTLPPVLVYLVVGLLLSTLVPHAAKGTSIALALLFGTYVAGVMSALVEQLGFLKWISPMQYVLPGDVLNSSLGLGTKSFDFGGLALSFVIIVAALVATYVMYGRKDLHGR